MKTTKIAASILSLSVIVPGLIVSNSVPTQAQINQPVCPQGYTDWQIQQGVELRGIAIKFTGLQNNWRYILNPATQQQFSEEQAQRLTPGDIVCIPSNWLITK
ncbi:hypothetical protein [Microcoleus sp. B9-D4]|uniref:hypothetical protein n=1 Tax=Microcoleus sp. B9-D4 TaxID=2818711 RepID=UPI002FD28D42